MLSCKEISEKASDYLDKDLPVFERVRFQMHLAMCRHCRRFVKQMQITISTLKELKPDEPSDEQVDDLARKLLEHREK